MRECRFVETLAVRPLLEPATDPFGHDPRSWYSETFWLPTIGPTCLTVEPDAKGNFI